MSLSGSGTSLHSCGFGALWYFAMLAFVPFCFGSQDSAVQPYSLICCSLDLDMVR